MFYLSINHFFEIIAKLYWLKPVIITLVVLIAFFSFFQIMKNYQKKTKSKLIIDSPKKILLFREPKKKVDSSMDSPKINNTSKTIADIFVPQRKEIGEKKKLFDAVSSLEDLSKNITRKALDASLTALAKETKATVDNVTNEQPTHTESFKIKAPKRKYSA